jgi:anti-sigma regulatory factor (Ser/Thr protein kinase)/anti-anti-sigma regulatory factor
MDDIIAAVDRDLDNAVTLVTLTGVLNVATTPLVGTTLLKCVAECPLAVVVDVNGLVVTSPVALTVFAAVQRQQRPGPTVALLICVDPAAPTGDLVHQILGRNLRVYRNRKDALDAVREGSVLIKRRRAHLTADPQSASAARRMVIEACLAWGLEDLADTAALVISELATNVVRHAHTDFDVTARLRGSYLHLSVRDGKPQPPDMPKPSGSDWQALPTEGRGLHLVSACAARWGAAVSGSGKIVWAALRVPGF